MAFKGFDPNVFMLLELNKFNDSKNFYDSVKEEIKEKAIVPMRQLAEDLGKELYAVDSKMQLNPTKMVSRIRRDTRFSKNKELYRANVWCMFMRDKHQWNYMPCMWFEYYPDSYSYGVGMFRTDAVYLEAYRKALRENGRAFLRALRSLEKTGAVACVESFKKDKPGIEEVSDALKPYYNAKNIHFICSSNEMKNLIGGSVKEELSCAISAFAPMYRFLLEIGETLIENGE